MKTIEFCTIIKNDKIASDIYSMVVRFTHVINVKAGQFANLYTGKGELMLPRPISICEVDKAANSLRFVYRMAGAGTEIFSKMQAGEKIRLLAPLGNGFDLNNVPKRVCIAGGGIGTPPMLELAKEIREASPESDIRVFTAFRSEPILTKDFQEHDFNPYIATDDGNVGFHGNIVELIKSTQMHFDVIYACGPTAMLKGIAALAEDMGCPAFVSMEERMACGFGVCVGCVTKIMDGNDFVSTKVCKDGPVFNSREVAWS